LLYAPAEGDDPAFRTAVAALTGGVVDYFDARAGTPSAVVLAGYDCVFTHPEFAYSDMNAFGDALANYVDAGGRVILGVYCTYTSGSSLGGRIMTPGYCPVTSPAGNNHFSTSAYIGDGTTAIHAGVLAYDCTFRDFLALQGAGIADGHYADGEIAMAYRPDGRVIYCNGSGASVSAGTGDWAHIVADAARSAPTTPSILYAPASSDDGLYRLSIESYTKGVVDYFDASSATPTAGLLATYDCIYLHPNSSYADPVTYGNELADFVDAGGRVILGCANLYDGFAIGGRILTEAYSPVASPTSALHPFVSAPYAGDGTSALHTGVSAYDCPIRDYLVTQGPGVVDGHFADGEIAAAYRPDGRVVYFNGAGPPLLGSGDCARVVANAATGNLATGPRLLWAPADSDDPAFRADIARRTGGVVDYFDASAATPTAGLMAGYDAVFTWPNYSYADRDLFGDRLANYVDAGGKVLLGPFSTYTSGFSLGGRIMTPGYSPVTSPGGLNHFTGSPYVGDGTTQLHHRILAYDCAYRDLLATQGGGLVDGHYTDGEIATAHRPDRRVIYLNGAGAPLAGTGDWGQLVANACLSTTPTGNLFACTDAGELLHIDVADGSGHHAAYLPSYGVAGAAEIDYDPASGTPWVQGWDGSYILQPFSIADGSATGPPASTGEAYYGMEFALGRLYAAGITGFCFPSDFGTVNPATGLGTVLGSTGTGPLAGLSFDARTSTMYGLTGTDQDCGTGNSQLVRMEVTGGAATVLGTTSFMGNSLAFGPGGDLFGGGSPIDGGNVYRINPTTGASTLIGPSGYSSLTGLMFLPLNTVAAQSPLHDQLQFSAPLPNPSREGAVQFRFTLPAGGDARLSLYDVAGRRVWEKALVGLTAGQHTAVWDGKTILGRQAAPGVYYAKIAAPTGSRTVKLVRLD
jgi:hypothetical protein